MRSRRSPTPIVLIGATTLIASVLLDCGGSNHVLQSVSVTPSSATSQMQFTATGMYNTPPMSVDITSTTTWCVALSTGVCDTEAQPGAQVVAGLAQCQSGASGTFTILAGQAGPEEGMNAPFPLKPFGTATITCP